MVVCARAHPNIALIKYWGKAASHKNIPAVGSLSITLRELFTSTRVTPASSMRDQVTINGQTSQAETDRVSRFLDILRQKADRQTRLKVDSRSNFPVAAGLASSASGFAALTLAASRCFELDLGTAELADLARQGSGSACRSMYGGFVSWHGRKVTQLAKGDHWPLTVVVAVVSTAAKPAGSTAAMELSRKTSAFFGPWTESQDADLEEARRAVLARDFAKLAEVSEYNCLKMHAVIMSSRPGTIYWKPASLAVMEVVSRLRSQGTPVFFTLDAGPQVKAVCLPEAADSVAKELASVPGVVQVMQSGLGPGAFLEAAA